MTSRVERRNKFINGVKESEQMIRDELKRAENSIKYFALFRVILAFLTLTAYILDLTHLEGIMLFLLVILLIFPNGYANPYLEMKITSTKINLENKHDLGLMDLTERVVDLEYDIEKIKK